MLNKSTELLSGNEVHCVFNEYFNFTVNQRVVCNNSLLLQVSTVKLDDNAHSSSRE